MTRLALVGFLLLLLVPSSSEALAPNRPAGVVRADLTIDSRVGVFKNGVRHGPKPVIPPYGRQLSGRGVFIVDINLMTGQARDVRVLKSTGTELLDDITWQALRQWLFQPRTVYKVTVPVAFRSGGQVKIGD